MIPSISPLFYCNYDLADFTWLLSVQCFIGTVISWSCTTVLLQLWVGRFLVLHHCFITIIIWLLSSVPRLFYCSYNWGDCFYSITLWFLLFFGRFPLWHQCFIEIWLGWFLLLQHCFIGIMIWLIASIAPLFYCNYDLAYFFCSTTALFHLRFGWFLPWHYCSVTINI